MRETPPEKSPGPEAAARAEAETRARRIEVEFLEGVRARLPEHAGVVESLGCLYTEMGRYQDGLRADREMVRMEPDSPNAWYNLACSLSLTGQPDDAFAALEKALRAKAVEFAGLLKTGRTHLQDAVPVTLGQEFGAYAHAVALAAARIREAAVRLRELGIGGNAVGTGINTKATFRAEIIRFLNEETDGGFRVAEDGVHLTQFMTDFAHMSAAYRSAALDLQKIANDLRLLASGPLTGIGEIRLPPVEPGSSIMPGKVNPSICEAVNMVCMQVQGLDHAVALACGAGQLELNTHMPLIGANCLQAAKLLSAAARVLAEKCVAGIAADAETCRRNLERSAGLPTLLNPRLGYDRVAQLVKEGLATGQTLKELALAKKWLTAAEYEALLASSTAPNL